MAAVAQQDADDAQERGGALGDRGGFVTSHGSIANITRGWGAIEFCRWLREGRKKALEQDDFWHAKPSCSIALFYRAIQTSGDSAFGHRALARSGCDRGQGGIA
jgi:hypothetical protein